MPLEFIDLTRERAAAGAAELLALGGDLGWDDWTPEQLLAERDGKWALSMAVLADGRPAGYAVASRRADAVHLHHLVLGPAWRNRGLGPALLARLARRARAAGLSRMTLKVYRSNAGAVRFYERLGFAPEAGDAPPGLLRMHAGLDTLLARPGDAPIPDPGPALYAAHQPNYVPWCGYFAKMRACDVFVFLDDVQMPNGRSYVYRSRVAGPGGEQWLSQPTRRSGGDAILDVRFAGDDWTRRHLGTLRALYGRSPHFEEIMALVAPHYAHPGERLADFNVALIRTIAGFLGLGCRFERSSLLRPAGRGDDRLVSLGRLLGAERYLSGKGGQNYQDPAKFAAAGLGLDVRVYAPRPYPRLSGGFIPGLSILDALFHVGREAAELLTYDSGGGA